MCGQSLVWEGSARGRHIVYLGLVEEGAATQSNIVELKAICVQMKEASGSIKGNMVDAVITWRFKHAHRGLHASNGLLAKPRIWVCSTMLATMLVFILGNCATRNTWEYWPTSIATPIRVLRVWEILSWYASAATQLATGVTGIPVLMFACQLRNIAKHMHTVWHTMSQLVEMAAHAIR